MFLNELDNCLSVVGMIEVVSDTKIFSHAPFLVILKGVHSITKIFSGLNYGSALIIEET